MSQLKKTDFLAIYSHGLNLRYPCPQGGKGDFLGVAPTVYLVIKLLSPGLQRAGYSKSQSERQLRGRKGMGTKTGLGA